MTRNKDTESHQRMAAEQELKVTEKAREHQRLRLKRRLKLRSRKQPSWKGGDTGTTTGGAANSYRSLKKPGRLQRRKPKNENMRWRLRSRRLSRLKRKLSLQLRLLTERNKLHTTKKAGQRAAGVVRDGIRHESGS